jgi:hypothetical protein
VPTLDRRTVEAERAARVLLSLGNGQPIDSEKPD